MDTQDPKVTGNIVAGETAKTATAERVGARLEPDGSLLLTGLSLAPVPDRVEPTGVVREPRGDLGTGDDRQGERIARSVLDPGIADAQSRGERLEVGLTGRVLNDQETLIQGATVCHVAA